MLYFEWIGDFSAARNTCIEAASGEWYMSLDADEIFQSCDGIIDFFNSGEYKKYNSASFVVRNLLKTENGVSADSFLELRMAKLTPETRFVGRVHEYMNKVDPPYKNIRDTVDHYGYFYATKEEQKKKFERNTELLLKKLEEEKDDNIMLYVQIYQSYMLVDNDETALSYLNKGIEVGREKNDYAVIALYYHKIAYYYTKKNYETALDICKDYFNMSKRISSGELTTNGEIYSIKAGCLYRLKRYSEAIDVFKQFFNIYKDIESGELTTYDAYLTSLSMCTPVNYLPAVNEYIDCCIQAGRFNTADGFICTFPVHEYSFDIPEIAKYVRFSINVLEHFEFNNTAKYYRQLNEVGKKIFVDELFGKLADTDNSDKVFGALSEIAKDDKKLSDKIEVYRKYYQNYDISENIRIYISEYGAAEDVDLILIAMQKQYDISCVFVDDIDIKRLAYSCCKGLKEFYNAAENYDVNCFADTENLSKLTGFYKYIMDTALLSDDDKRHIPELLKRFADCGREGGSDILQAAALVRNAMRYHENKQYKECIEEIKRAINTYEPLGAVLSEYSKLVLDEYEKAAKAVQPQNEMQVLANVIKKNIRAFIAAGNMDAARKTLNDYKQIAPNDPDIAELMNELN